MNILLDTNVLVFALSSVRLLNQQVRTALEDRANDVFFSAVSIWEVAIKAALGKPGFNDRPETVLRMARAVGFAELTVGSDVVARVADLPLHHGDPFDRLLIAQAMHYPARLYTTDRTLTRYSELVTLVR